MKEQGYRGGLSYKIPGDRAMKEILLVASGSIMSTSAFHYAVDLCRRMNAQLLILLFIPRKPAASCRLIPDLNSKKRQTADASAAVKDLLSRSQNSDLPYKISLSTREPEKELPDFIDTHLEIVLTVFDPSLGRPSRISQKRKPVKRIKKMLSVPLVVVKQ